MRRLTDVSDTIGSKFTKLAVNFTLNMNILLEVERVTNVSRNTFIAHFSYTDDWITKLNTLIKSRPSCTCTTIVNNY